MPYDQIFQDNLTIIVLCGQPNIKQVLVYEIYKTSNQPVQINWKVFGVSYFQHSVKVSFIYLLILMDQMDTIGENSFLFSQTYSNFPCVENTKTAKTSTFCNMYFHFLCIFFIKVQGKLADAAFVQKKNMYLDQTFWVTLMSEPLKNVKYSILFVSDLG